MRRIWLAVAPGQTWRSAGTIGKFRRNSLFAGSAAGGEHWAILSSLINSAKLNGIDPQTYIANVLERLVSGDITINRIEELLPWAWKAARDTSLLERAA